MSDKTKTDFTRSVEASFRKGLEKPYVQILFGARQTGKTTLMERVLPEDALRINLADSRQRLRYTEDPGEFIRLCESLPKRTAPWVVFVDEAQTVPALFDNVQYLYDQNKTRWRFVLCGSSARKLRKAGSNLLPGRSFLHHLFPLTLEERPPTPAPATGFPSPFSFELGPSPAPRFPATDLMTRLATGELPGVATADAEDRGGLLRSYIEIFVEEEIRRESLVKEWGTFVRFLRLAGTEAGNPVNFTHLSQECGISAPTIKNHYGLLEDLFLGFSVPAFTRSARNKILSTPKFLFFDIGIRHAAAGLTPSADTVTANPGPIFEQWVGIELWKRLQYHRQGTLYYQRSRDGAEVDYIVEQGTELIPIEVKWTEHPTASDARHLITFLKENHPHAQKGYVICRCPTPQKLTDTITAWPWNYL